MKKKIKTNLPFLTIGYATHNRKKIVRNRLIEALQLNFENNFEIILKLFLLIISLLIKLSMN